MSDTPITWPATLPGPVLEGLGFKRKSGLRQAEMEAGPNRQRRITSTRTYSVTAKWVLTAAQFAVFQAFFDSSINDGADWFDAKWRLWDGRQTRSVRFTNGEFDVKPDGPNVWNLTATLDWRA